MEWNERTDERGEEQRDWTAERDRMKKGREEVRRTESESIEDRKEGQTDKREG